MKIHYQCEQCGQAIDTLEVPYLNETKLGFDVLTDDERHQLIYHDEVNDAIYVQSLCDLCIEAMGLEPKDSAPTAVAKPMIH